MATPTTLLEVAGLEQSSRQAERGGAQSALATAQAALATEQSKRALLGSQLRKLEDQAAELRRQLPDAPMRADAEALLAHLETKIIAIRAANAGILDADAAADEAGRQAEAAQAELAAATALAAAATAARDQVQAEHDRRQAWKTGVAKAPLKDVPAQATAALDATAEPMKSAKARVEADIPAELIARARERGSNARAALARIADLADDAENKVSSATGGVVKAEAAFRRAEARLGDYFRSAVPDLARAVEVLATIPTAPKLTQAEIDRIADADIVKAGKAAATKESARDAARAAREAAQAALDKAILAARANDVDVDPATVQAVIDRQKDYDDTAAPLTQAEAAYTAKMRDELDRWEATVPDATWRLLADFEDARATLDRLKAADPAALAAAATAREGDLVTALLAASKSGRTHSALILAATRSESRFAAAANSATARLFSAIRGDA
jgi:hypothetical protein